MKVALSKSTPIPNAEACYYARCFDNADELYQRLYETTDWRQENVMIFGRPIPQPRLTAWYGDVSYTYSGLTVAPQPFNETIREIKAHVEAAADTPLNSVLLNLYRDGQDLVGWHSDGEPGVGPVIASVSFGSPRRFLLRDTATKTIACDVPLGNGDLLIMGAGVQESYQHQVPKTAKVVGPRINLTFRQMRVATVR
jgi:alkylated DNA repair dioxygenase AlkB